MRRWLLVLAVALAVWLPAGEALAQLAVPRIPASGSPQDVAINLQILALLTVLSLAPAILLMMTAFTRILIVLSFTRQALGTPMMPPNQVVLGLAMFLTFFVMAPTLTDVNREALQPYLEQRISQAQALDRAQKPIRQFMFRQTRQKDIALFVSMAKLPRPRRPDDIPTLTLIPAFIISELKTAFQIGFVIYLPFLVIDLVVSSLLMSMGMMMLPPVVISLPFKLVLFVLCDGWHLLSRALVASFR
ncbi:MAG: flagellar type III secretion system pore protein FliP [bacterium]|nr:flagellar type III secretion system pore protein FliP [bacterium]